MRVNKQWWDDELKQSKSDLRKACRIWLKNKGNSQFRTAYVAAQKRFDKIVRKKKREFNRTQRTQLQKRSPRQFWRDIRSLGISETGKPTNIPAEVELEDGSICSD